MALLLIEGFETWSSGADAPPGYSVPSNAYPSDTYSHGGFTVTPRFGYGKFLVHHSSGGGSASRFPLPSSSSTIFMGFALRRYSNTENRNWRIGLMESGTTHVNIQVTNHTTLTVRRNTSTLGSPITLPYDLRASWVYVEMKAVIHDSLGYVEVRVNGETVYVFNGDTKNGGSGLIDSIFTGSDGACMLDDMYVCDDTGAANNDFLGDVRVVAMSPDGDGHHSDFTPLSGSNYENVDDLIPNDSDYVSSDVVGHKDSYTYENTPNGLYDVLGVRLSTRARKTDPGPGLIRPFARIDGADYPCDTKIVTTEFNTYVDILDVNPSTGAQWSQSDIDSAEFGVEIVD